MTLALGMLYCSHGGQWESAIPPRHRPSAASPTEENTISAFLCTRTQEVNTATVRCFQEVFKTMPLFNLYHVEILCLLNGGKKDDPKHFLQKQRITGYAYCLRFEF